MLAIDRTTTPLRLLGRGCLYGSGAALLLDLGTLTASAGYAVYATAAAVWEGSYYATPHNLHWHIALSWPRLTEHVAVPLAYAVMAGPANGLRREVRLLIRKA